jgi:hypothetical protein
MAPSLRGARPAVSSPRSKRGELYTAFAVFASVERHGQQIRRCSILSIISSRCRNEDDLLMSQVERTPDAARKIADAWKQAALAKAFTDCGDEREAR